MNLTRRRDRIRTALRATLEAELPATLEGALDDARLDRILEALRQANADPDERSRPPDGEPAKDRPEETAGVRYCRACGVARAVEEFDDPSPTCERHPTEPDVVEAPAVVTASGSALIVTTAAHDTRERTR